MRRYTAADRHARDDHFEVAQFGTLYHVVMYSYIPGVARINKPLPGPLQDRYFETKRDATAYIKEIKQYIQTRKD
jgi:hypothetical protein